MPKVRRATEVNNTKIPVPYVSVWDGGVEVETTALVNIKTGEVTDVTTAKVEGLDICEREYIVMNDWQLDVNHDERGFALWVDINNENQGGGT
jgi:hypothetical protein